MKAVPVPKEIAQNFSELFKRSAFVAKYFEKVPIKVANISEMEGPFVGSHLGLKRPLPVPNTFNRVIELQQIDRAYSYTVFEDVTNQTVFYKLWPWISMKARGKWLGSV
jgi:hypothetical protein